MEQPLSCSLYPSPVSSTLRKSCAVLSGNIAHASQKTAGHLEAQRQLSKTSLTITKTPRARPLPIDRAVQHRPESRVMGGHVAFLVRAFLLQRTLWSWPEPVRATVPLDYALPCCSLYQNHHPTGPASKHHGRTTSPVLLRAQNACLDENIQIIMCSTYMI